MAYANRGMAFEQMIEYTNRLYEQKRLCVINKRPTPVRVTSFSRGKVWGFFEKPSTVDFDGFLANGRSIVFEAKESKELAYFPLKNLQDHQVEYLVKAHENNAISFLLINMSKQRKIYLLTAETLKCFWQRRKKGGRGTARISLEELDIYAHDVPSGKVPVNYLAVVNEVWKVAS